MRKKKQALKISVTEGAAANISSGIGESYITPFLLALQASSSQIGILNAISGITNPIAQLFGSRIKRNSRKEVVLPFSFSQIFLWLILLAISIFALKNGANSFLIIGTIIVYSAILGCHGALYPAWFSWMGDLTADKTRGSYLARRTAIIGAASLIVVIIGSFLLDYLKERTYLMWGFIALFGFALITRIIAFVLIKKQYEPKQNITRNYKIGFFKFFREKTNAAQFARAMMIFNFSVMIASPFFTVYALKELQLPYIWYTIIFMSGAGFHLIFTPLLGRFSDKYGSVNLLRIGGFLFILPPLIWLRITDPILLIFIPQLISGMANAAMNVGTTNFSYSVLEPNKRETAISYINLMGGVGILLGSLIGGLLIDNLPKVAFNSMLIVFVISAIARTYTAFFVIPKIRFEKKVEKGMHLSLDLIHPIKTIHTDSQFIRHLIKD